MSDHCLGVFDDIEGGIASGWAYNPFDVSTPVTIDFFARDRLVHSTIADLYRADVSVAEKKGHRCGFRTFLQVPRTLPGDVQITARIREANLELRNSPKPFMLPPAVRNWLSRTRRSSDHSTHRLRRRLNRHVTGHSIAIIVPFHNTRSDWLSDAVESVLTQWCDAWQLICVDDASSEPHVAEMLQHYAARDNRIKYIRNAENLGIAASVNVGIAQSDSEMVAFMDHDDCLEPDAVYHYLRAAGTGAALIYCDELVTGESLDDVRLVAARPAFSYEYYLQHPYFVHMICVRRSVLASIGGWTETMPISADVDLVLRILEQARSVAHIAKVLYRWRTHPESAGHRSKQAVMTATVEAIARHLDRRGEGGRVEARRQFNHFRVTYPPRPGVVLIVIPTKNGVDFLRKCIVSIEKTTHRQGVKICVVDHASDDPATLAYLRELSDRVHIQRIDGEFNYSKINNDAVMAMRAGCDYVLFLNNDVEAMQPGWLDRLKSVAGRRGVGAVGATLLYGSGAVQHAGVVVGINGLADHAHRGARYIANGSVNPGYLSSLIAARDYSAVTGACLLMRLSVFDAVQGFDERLKIAFNDTDLCLRISTNNLSIINVSDVILFHYESQTRKSTKNMMEHTEDSERFTLKWKEFIRNGDPFYNPILSLKGRDHELTFAGILWDNVGAIRVVETTAPGE